MLDCKGGLGCTREGGLMLNRSWARLFELKFWIGQLMTSLTMVYGLERVSVRVGSLNERCSVLGECGLRESVDCVCTLYWVGAESFVTIWPGHVRV